MALNVGQLLSPPVNTQVGGVKAGTGITIDADGTISTEGGGSFPGTTINFPTTIPGTAASTPWGAPGTLLFSTGCLEFAVDGVTFNQGPTAVVAGNIVTTRWVSSPSCSGAPNGTVITGTLTDGTYTVSSNFQIDRVPSGFAFGDLTSQPLSSLVTSNPLIPSGFNSTAYVTVQVGATLTGVQASVGGGAFTAIPTTGTTLPINPGQSLQIRGTTGSTANTTYSVVVSIGADASVSSDTWDVTTVAATAAIAQPSITAPPNGTTNLNPAVNTPAGITLTSSAYSPLNGAGAQTSSEWEVYEAIPQQPETSGITNVASSPAGNSWTVANWSGWPANYAPWGVIKYLNGAWFATGGKSSPDPGYILKSTDGNTWTSLTLANQPTGIIYGIAYKGGTYVAVGQNGRILYSTDGSTWISSGPNSGITFEAVAASSTTFVAAGGSGTNISVRTSPDGINWTERSISWGTSGTDIIYGCAYGNGLFVISGNSGGSARIMTSPDGVTWTLRSTGLGTSLLYAGVEFGEGLFMVGGTGGAVATSSDGITWNTSTVAGAVFGGFTAGGGLYVGLDSLVGGRIFTSTNGTSWAPQTIAGAGDIRAMGYGNNEFIGGTSSNPAQILKAAATVITLTFTDATNLANMAADDSVVEIGGGGDASGTIGSINVAGPTITLSASSGTWNVGATVQDTTAPTVIPPAPTTTPPNPSEYTAVTGSPFTDTSAPFTTLFIPQSSLATSSNYFARVQYATTNTQAATSPFSAWSSFGTASSFAAGPGTPLGGGYFGGQINVSGTIYNLIVAPVTGTGGQQGQYGGASPQGIQYKTNSSADGGATLDEAYGGLATTNFANNEHPMFNWCVNGANGPRSNGGIGGFTDWYIPAKYELAILYFFLKPDSTANNTGSGSNPNSVAPYTPNTNYSTGFPNQTTSTLFQTGGAQAFSTAASYWSSTESSSNAINAWRQFFSSGDQGDNAKGFNNYARAIRRTPA